MRRPVPVAPAASSKLGAVSHSAWTTQRALPERESMRMQLRFRIAIVHHVRPASFLLCPTHRFARHARTASINPPASRQCVSAISGARQDRWSASAVAQLQMLRVQIARKTSSPTAAASASCVRLESTNLTPGSLTAIRGNRAALANMNRTTRATCLTDAGRARKTHSVRKPTVQLAQSALRENTRKIMVRCFATKLRARVSCTRTRPERDKLVSVPCLD